MSHIPPVWDPLAYINDYTDTMSISQVVRFFEKQGITLTRSMIQNYVRLELIPPPEQKRHYKRKHFILLTLILYFKDIFSLDLLKPFMQLFWKDQNDALLIQKYEQFLQYQKDAVATMQEKATAGQEQGGEDRLFETMVFSAACRNTACDMMSAFFPEN